MDSILRQSSSIFSFRFYFQITSSQKTENKSDNEPKESSSEDSNEDIVSDSWIYKVKKTCIRTNQEHRNYELENKKLWTSDGVCSEFSVFRFQKLSYRLKIFLFQIAAGSSLCDSNQKRYTQKPDNNNADKVKRCNLNFV